MLLQSEFPPLSDDKPLDGDKEPADAELGDSQLLPKDERDEGENEPHERVRRNFCLLAFDFAALALTEK